jgi:hypothetical protein
LAGEDFPISSPELPKSEVANDSKPNSVNWKDGVKDLSLLLRIGKLFPGP